MSIEMQSIKRTEARARYQRLVECGWHGGSPLRLPLIFGQFPNFPSGIVPTEKSVSEHNVEVVNYSPTNATRRGSVPQQPRVATQHDQGKNDSFAAVWMQICAPPWSNSHRRSRLSTNDFSGDHALLCFKLRESFVAG